MNRKVGELKHKIWLSGMMGLIVGDALGILVEFFMREDHVHTIKEN